jgi:hypothetical protein
MNQLAFLMLTHDQEKYSFNGSVHANIILGDRLLYGDDN